MRPQGLRALADQSPASFLNLARMLLGEGRDTTGARQVLSMLAARGWLAPMIREVAQDDPGLAGSLAHLGLSVYPALERELAAPPVEGVAANTDPSLAQDLIAAIETALALLPAPTQTVKPLDAKSRATLARVYSKLAVARRHLEKLLKDSEPRVRANAVEALWHLPAEQTSEFLREAARESHHRVAANALVGLSLAGDEQALSGLVEMAERGEGLVRLAAVWAMGRTGDARFTAFLKKWRLRHRGETNVLRGSLAALVKLRQAETLSTARPARLDVLSSRRAGGDVVIEALARGANGESVSAGGGHMQPWLGEEPVWAYRAALEPFSTLARVLCVLPAGVAREEAERMWAERQGRFPGEVRFGDDGGEFAWTHIVRFAGSAQAAPHQGDQSGAARIYTLSAARPADVAGMLDELTAVLRGVWVIRFPDPGAEAGELTLRLRSPEWSAGPVSAAVTAAL